MTRRIHIHIHDHTMPMHQAAHCVNYAMQQPMHDEELPDGSVIQAYPCLTFLGDHAIISLLPA